MRVLELPVEYLDLAAATRYPKPKKRFFPGGDWDGRGQIGLVDPDDFLDLMCLALDTGDDENDSQGQRSGKRYELIVAC